MNSPKRTPASKNRSVKRFEFDVEQTLLKNRQIFDLFDDINDHSAKNTIKKLYALATLNDEPIHLYLNSGGGYCSSGLAIIDAMKTIDAPVVTIITNEVCSMAGHISISGDKRVCYKSSVFMAHDMGTYMDDYSLKIKDRAEFTERYYNILEDHLREHTNLPENLIEKARVGELWLLADDMLKYGIVDEIIEN